MDRVGDDLIIGEDDELKLDYDRFAGEDDELKLDYDLFEG